MSEQQKVDIADWVVDTCLLFGTNVLTAYRVATLFLEAVEESLAQ